MRASASARSCCPLPLTSQCFLNPPAPFQEAAKFAGPVVEGKRQRKVLRGYNEDAAWKALSRRGAGGNDASDDDDSEGRKRRRGGGGGDGGWRGEGEEEEDDDEFQGGKKAKKVRGRGQ